MLILCFKISEIKAWCIMTWKFRVLLGRKKFLSALLGSFGWSNEINMIQINRRKNSLIFINIGIPKICVSQIVRQLVYILLWSKEKAVRAWEFTG